MPASSLTGLAVLLWRRRAEAQKQAVCSADPLGHAGRDSSLLGVNLGEAALLLTGQERWLAPLSGPVNRHIIRDAFGGHLTWMLAFGLCFTIKSKPLSSHETTVLGQTSTSHNVARPSRKGSVQVCMVLGPSNLEVLKPSHAP